ncbi:MAG: 4Fe-4S binding protein [Candidatus Omnitrophota bacterium]
MKYKFLPVFDIDKCSGCRACADVCRAGSLSIIDEIVRFQNPAACLSEQRCVNACPMGGIRMEWLPIEECSLRGLVLDYKPEMAMQ